MTARQVREDRSEAPLDGELSGRWAGPGHPPYLRSAGRRRVSRSPYSHAPGVPRWGSKPANPAAARTIVSDVRSATVCGLQRLAK